MDKFIQIEIPYKSYLANLVKGFSSTFSTVTNFRCESISPDNKELELEINYGKNYLEYKFDDEIHIIIIDYQEIGDPVGTYFSAEKLEKLVVMIEHNDENKEIKKNCIAKFLKDAKNFYNKKDDTEIICKILKGGYWSVLSKLPR